jgi:Protein of unknown function (DUF3617)
MLRVVVITSLFALALSACGQSAPDGSGKTAAENLEKQAAEVAFQFEPGQYRTTITVHKIDMPGAPPAAAAQLKAMMSKGQTSERCLTKEQASKGMDMMKEGMAKGKCNFEKFDASGGKINSVFSCQTGQGQGMRAESQGTYSPTGSEVLIKVDTAMPGGNSMHLEQTVKSERIGDCK